MCRLDFKTKFAVFLLYWYNIFDKLELIYRLTFRKAESENSFFNLHVDFVHGIF